MEVLISHGDDGGAKGLHGGEDEDPTATRRDDSPIGWTGGRRAQKRGMQLLALVGGMYVEDRTDFWVNRKCVQ